MPETKEPIISDFKHPSYVQEIADWNKWRLTYEGDDAFIDTYLKKFSKRESKDSYARRRDITYNPAFAAEVIDEIKDSIFERFVDITRVGGTKTYQDAVNGMDGGVDRYGSSMSTFVGQQILPELLVMKKVGIYVDMPEKNGDLLIQNYGKRPYIYCYRTEDILNWVCDYTNEYSSILLRDYKYEFDPKTGFPTKQVCNYRHVWINQDGYVTIRIYGDDGEQKIEDRILNIRRIPFALTDIGKSLIANICNYQIALLNISSSDIGYILQSNFPFYVEQYHPLGESMRNLRTGSKGEGGESGDAAKSGPQEINIGTSGGRLYAKDTDRPAFIHPSPEPLRISMEKQEQMKSEMRQLAKLSIAALQPKLASAESKGFDRQGLEAGLSFIGISLQNSERKVAQLWSLYENSTDIATVNYPQRYNLKTDDERRAEIKSLDEISGKVPSAKFFKSIAKQIARLAVGTKVSNQDLLEIEKEIDAAIPVRNDPESIQKDIELGIADTETASQIRMYPPGVAEKAKKEHAERLARINEAQSTNQNTGNGNNTDNPAARGLKDQAGDLTGGSKEKQKSRDRTTDPNNREKQRGKGQGNANNS